MPAPCKPAAPSKETSASKAAARNTDSAPSALAVESLLADAHTFECIHDQYRHCKTIVAPGASSRLLEVAGVSRATATGEPDVGLVVASTAREAFDALEAALSRPRNFDRETDPPKL